MKLNNIFLCYKIILFSLKNYTPQEEKKKANQLLPLRFNMHLKAIQTNFKLFQTDVVISVENVWLKLLIPHRKFVELNKS